MAHMVRRRSESEGLARARDRPYTTTMRLEYEGEPLRAADLATDPIRQLEIWLRDAVEAGLSEPNAMTLATAGADGLPSARMVLLKHVDERGFVFCTNLESRKGRDLAARPAAALVFWWPSLVRQVRVEGRVQGTPNDESDAHHRARPRGAQIAAWASPQSRFLEDREAIDRRFREAERRFAADAAVPRPPHWGCYRVAPERIEFWRGGLHRLSDRFLYRRAGDGSWLRTRLAP